MEKLVTRYEWLKYDNDQRLLMRAIFHIPKSGGVEMQDNKMLSDGSNENDLRAINIESMQQFVESEVKDFDKLFEMTIEKVNELLKEEADRKTEEERKKNTGKRLEDIEQIVDSTLETIAKLPIDAQVKIKVALSNVGETNNEQKDEKPKTKGAKKAGETGNE